MLRWKFPEDKHGCGRHSRWCAALGSGMVWEELVQVLRWGAASCLRAAVGQQESWDGETACPRTWGGSRVAGQHWLHTHDWRCMAKGAGQEWSRIWSCSSRKPMTWLKSAGWELWCNCDHTRFFQNYFFFVFKGCTNRHFWLYDFYGWAQGYRKNIINRSSNNSTFGMRRASCLDAMISRSWMFKDFAIANPEFTFKLEEAVGVRACCHWRAASPRGTRAGCSVSPARGKLLLCYHCPVASTGWR